MKQRHTLIAVALLLFLPVVAQAQKVTVDFDKAADFSKFKTYAWGKGTPVANPLSNERVTAGIEGQLAAKGLQKVEGDAADLLVAWHGAIGQQTQLNTMNTGGWGAYGRFGGGTSTTTVQNIPTGQLIVDIGDMKNKKFIWRGTATDTLSDKPEKNQKKLAKALTKMFEKFPPPPGK